MINLITRSKKIEPHGEEFENLQNCSLKRTMNATGQYHRVISRISSDFASVTTWTTHFIILRVDKVNVVR